MRATQYLLSALHAEGVVHVFLVPGGLIDPFYPDLCDGAGVQPIVAAHEGGAAYMADGYARASGRFGVCFAIGGPGVTNTLTALAAALTDESPVLLLSGEVPTDWEGRGGFQDASAAGLNDIEILRPVTTFSMEVESPHLVDHHLRRALTTMLGPDGAPVHLSLPRDLQTTEVGATYRPLFPSAYTPRFLDVPAVDGFWEQVVPGRASAEGARKIAIYAGHGVTRSGAAEELRAFAERFEIPVATTLKAKGVLPEDHRLALGVFGYAGTRHAIETLLSDDVEVLLVLGSGLNQRDTLYWSHRLRPSKALVQVNIDPGAISHNFPADVAIVGDCRELLRHLLSARGANLEALEAGMSARAAWLETIRASGPCLYDAENCTSESIPIHPARAIAELRRALPRDAVLLVDSGAHRAFAGHYWEAYGPRQYISATNLGPMGWAIPAAIGVKLARPELPCAVVTGDGCMLMHGMEVQTAARHHVPVIWAVINNGALGNVYLRAKRMGAGPAALTSLPTHDWAGFARALGAQGATVEAPDQLAPAFEQALAANAPFVVDVRCGKDFPTPVTPWTQAAKEWMDND
jgi:acetolactate synthase-1/2/3 large subunit